MANPAFKALGATASGIAAISPAWPIHSIWDVALLVIQTYYNQPATLSDAQGFVQVTGSPIEQSAGACLSVYWKRATASNMAAPTVADSGDHQIARIHTYSNVYRTGNPWDVIATDTGAASATHTFTGVTTTLSNELIVFMDAVVNYLTTGFTGLTNANLLTPTIRSDQAYGGGSNNGGFMVGDGLFKNKGAVGNTTVTCPSSRAYAFMTLALKGNVVPNAGAVELGTYGVM